MFSVSVIVSSNFHIMQFLHQMFNVSAMLLGGDIFKPATPLTNGVIGETLRQFASLRDISQGSVATQLTCSGIFSDGIIEIFFADFSCETVLQIG